MDHEITQKTKKVKSGPRLLHSNGEYYDFTIFWAFIVGQLSNQSEVELTREGFDKMFCLTGTGGDFCFLSTLPVLEYDYYQQMLCGLYQWRSWGI